VRASAGRLVSKRCRSAAEAVGDRASNARSSGWTVPFVAPPPCVCDVEADGPCDKPACLRHSQPATNGICSGPSYSCWRSVAWIKHSSVPRQAIRWTC